MEPNIRPAHFVSSGSASKTARFVANPFELEVSSRLFRILVVRKHSNIYYASQFEGLSISPREGLCFGLNLEA